MDESDSDKPDEAHEVENIVHVDNTAGLPKDDEESTKTLLSALNRLLMERSGISDLRCDASLMLKAIRMQQESFIKDYDTVIDLDTLIMLANNGELLEFFTNFFDSNVAAQFVTQLALENKPEVKERAARTKYSTVEGTAQEPKKAKVGKKTLQSVERIKKIVKSVGPTEYFTFIVDPESYSNTVKNAFDLSLAVRLKEVSLVEIDGVLFVGEYTPGKEVSTQSVLQITPAQHRALVKTLGIEKGLLNS